MDESNTLPLDRHAFREIVRHPQAHAHVLSIYRLGEYAGVVALNRLLREMQPDGKLHEAMTLHHRDERRHAAVFTDWIERLGQTPAPYPETWRTSSPMVPRTLQSDGPSSRDSRST